MTSVVEEGRGEEGPLLVVPVHVQKECVALEVDRPDFVVDLRVCEEQAVGVDGVDGLIAVVSEVFRERYRFW